LDDRGSIPGKGFFFLFVSVQTGFAAHAASYPVGTGGSYPGNKANFASITLCVASQRVFIVVYFVIDSVRKLLDTPSCAFSLLFKQISVFPHTTNIVVSTREI
jgi:hypothetical protein